MQANLVCHYIITTVLADNQCVTTGTEGRVVFRGRVSPQEKRRLSSVDR